MKKIINRLKEIRKKLNLSQKIVANAIGISINTYSKYERNITQPNMKILIRFSNYYNLKIQYIVGLTDKE